VERRRDQGAPFRRFCQLSRQTWRHLDRARGFIRGMARQWLDWWRDDEASARAASRENVDERRRPRKKKA
jgi:glycine/D-amino acid oxidase-like deaminating enzyme